MGDDRVVAGTEVAPGQHRRPMDRHRLHDDHAGATQGALAVVAEVPLAGQTALGHVRGVRPEGDPARQRPVAQRQRLEHVRERHRPCQYAAMASAPPLIVVAGPTATGKTELGIRLAEALIADGRPATVISADSRQVYRGLDIGTAKVTAEERARVPHAGLDLVEPDQRFALADYRRPRERGPRRRRRAGRRRAARRRDRALPACRSPWPRSRRAARRPGRPRATRRRARVGGPRAPRGAAAGRGAGTRRRGPSRQPAAGDPRARDRRAPRRRPASAADRLPGSGGVDRAGCRPVPSTIVASAPGHAPSSTPAWSTRPSPCGGASTRSSPRSPRSATARPGPSPTARSPVDAAVEADARRNVAFAKRQRTWFRAEPDVTWLDATDDDPLPTALAVTRAILGRP